MNISRDRQQLLEWYKINARNLPWRANRDPYRIWISEIMLQQTTVTAVRPFFERFTQRFPNLETLAQSPIEDVIEHWAGLGYYSRARNLHKAAQKFVADGGMPKGYAELIQYSGLGPYTARAISSIAHDEPVGVVDGNVIRILSRKYGIAEEFWKPKNLKVYQELADKLAQCDSPSSLNQAMMELGATVCTPKSPTCLLCPWNKTCVAYQEDRIADLPLSKPRAKKTIWLWRPKVFMHNGELLLKKNDYAPFLKGQWFLPGEVESLKSAPKNFLYRHSITTYDIFVEPKVTRLKSKPNPIEQDELWIKAKDIKKYAPVSLISKLLEKIEL